MDRHPNDLTTDEEIAQALVAAREFDGEPRALSAEYVRATDAVVIRLTTGGRLLFPREDLQGLQNATAEQLSEISFGAAASASPGHSST
jgi:hypothetical protein